MRKIILTLLSLGALVACNNKTPDKPQGVVKLDPYAKLYVNYQATKSDENGLETAEYIVKNCSFVGSKIRSTGEDGFGDLGIQEHTYNIHRDFIDNRFVFDGLYAVYEDGTPGHFFDLENVVFTVAKFNDERVFPTDIITLEGLQQDTIAYIPNAVMNEIRVGIAKAIKEGDFAKCHSVLNESFVFIPVKDGAEWRRLEGK